MSPDPKSVSLETCLQSVRDFLLGVEKAGSWSYNPGGDASLETTAWAATALRQRADVCRRVVSFLSGAQNGDGGWSTRPGLGQSDWTSALALFALKKLSARQLEDTEPLMEKAASYLIDARAKLSGFSAWLTFASLGMPIFLPGSPVGWPWNEGCFFWVEPTSYSIIALKSEPKSSNAAEAVRRAQDFLLTHACKEGGWNHGNNISFGRDLPPYPATTAVALIALSDRRDLPAVRAGLARLKEMCPNQHTPFSLALSIIALTSFSEPVGEAGARLAAMQAPDGGFGRTVLTAALSAIALECVQGENPLEFQGG